MSCSSTSWTHICTFLAEDIGHGCGKFPKIQFIIATHSPFIAQVADPEAEDARGEANAIASGNIRLEDTPTGVKALPSGESARLLGPEQILQSDLFDMKSVLAPPVEAKIHQFEQLHRRRKEGELNPEEKRQYEQLGRQLENLPLALSPEVREEEQQLRDALHKQSDAISKLE